MHKLLFKLEACLPLTSPMLVYGSSLEYSEGDSFSSWPSLRYSIRSEYSSLS